MLESKTQTRQTSESEIIWYTPGGMIEINMLKYVDAVIDLNPFFVNEIIQPDFEGRIEGHLILTRHRIWSYKRANSLRVYWLTRKTYIHKVVEIEWLRYLERGFNHPKIKFSDYLLSGDSLAKFRPETVAREIEIWYEIKNQILQ